LAAVNYNQGAGPDVAPDVRTPDDYQHVEAKPADFGAAAATGAEKAGQGLLQLNQFYNQSAADQATNNFVTDNTTLLHGDPNKTTALPDGTVIHDTGFYGKQGHDMMDAYGPTLAALQENLKNRREELPSGEAQLHFDQYSRRYLQIEQERMGAAYDAAQKGWMVNNNTVTATQTLDEISRHADDDKAVAGYIENLKTAYGKTAHIHGLGAAGDQEAARNAEIDGTKARLAALAVTAPARAYQIAQDKESLLGDQGPALVEKYKAGAETANVTAGMQSAYAFALNKPTSELAATTGGKAPPPGTVVDAATIPRNMIGAAADQSATPTTAEAVAKDNAIGAANIASGKVAAGAVPGATPDDLRTVSLESRGRDVTNASGHVGYVQAAPQWWQSFGGGGSPHNLADSVAALHRENDYNRPILGRVLRRDPTGADFYLAHQQGTGGAVALLSHPDANVVDALTPAYGGNRALAISAVLGNGGNVNMSAGQFAGMWESHFNGAPTVMGHGQTMILPPEASGAPPTAPTMDDLQGAPQGAQVQPAVTTTDPAKPLDAGPDPETPQEKIERLKVAKDASLVYALNAHPEWNDKQQREAERQNNVYFMGLMVAAQGELQQQNERKDVLGEKVSKFVVTGHPDQAFAAIQDPNNGLTWTERRVMSKALESEVGQENPATMGPGFNSWIHDRVLAPAGSPQRVGSGQIADIIADTGEGKGLTWRGAAKVMDTIQKIQKSEDGYGNAQMLSAAADRAKDKIFHEEDIGTYHTRPPQAAMDAREAFTNKLYSEFDAWRAAGHSAKDFYLFKPEEADKVIDGLYPLRQRLMARMGAEAEGAPLGAKVAAPAGVDAKAWDGFMSAPPIIGNGTKIVPFAIWGQAMQNLLADQSPANIAAFDNSIIGKASGTDGATLIEGLTGRAAALNRYEPGASEAPQVPFAPGSGPRHAHIAKPPPPAPRPYVAPAPFAPPGQPGKPIIREMGGRPFAGPLEQFESARPLAPSGQKTKPQTGEKQ
jgi:hypothetical protein